MAKRGRAEDALGPTSVVAPLMGSGISLLEGEVTRHEEANTEFFLNSTSAGKGKLFITTQRLAWLPDAPESQGYAIEYPNIALHAVCRDPDAFELPCIFCQLNIQDCEDESATDAENATVISELRLVPANATSLDAIFAAMSACAELHPDPAMEDDDECDADSEMMGTGMGGPGE